MMRLILIMTCLLMIGSCKMDKHRDAPVKELEQKEKNHNSEDDKEPITKFAPQSTDEQTANNIKNFLINDFLADDLSFLQPDDRKFQFYKVDLNDDGKKEIFIRFLSPYFCGSGGCTFLLLDKYGEIITKFSVTRAPIFIEQVKVNGWSLLLVEDSGVFKELIFQDGSYPSNPSLLPKAPYDAPSGHAEVMFDESFGRAKTFEY